MDKISIHGKSFVPYITYEEIQSFIDEVADKLNADYCNDSDTPILLCTLNGAMMFTSEIMKRLKFDCELMSVKIRSYSGAHTTGIIQETMGLTGDVKGRRIIIMEDIVDTGTTMAYLTDLLREREARDVKICTMLFKPSQYKKDIKMDYVGRVVENKLILGFGLDYDELGRQYKDIYVLDE